MPNKYNPVFKKDLDITNANVTTNTAQLSDIVYNVKSFGAVGDGVTNDYQAFKNAIDTLKSIPTMNRKKLIVPYTPNGYAVGQTVLFDLSNFTLELNAKIKLSSTTRQTALLFASDMNQAPASVLQNVQLIGNNITVDGNGSNMTFTYANGDGSDNHSAVRFNRVQNLYVTGINATNGAIDTFSLRACQNYLIDKCSFSNSKEDNGFSSTTHFGTYSRGDWTTYSYGTIRDCIAYNNQDFGMTAYNSSGVTFINCISYNNRSGYSMEDSYTIKDTYYYEVKFINCKASNCKEEGWYIDGNGVTIDDNCQSWNIRGYTGDNTAGTKENGVVVSQCSDIYVGGKHQQNGLAGIAIFNGNGMEMNVTICAKCTDNDAQGIKAKGISLLILKPGTHLKNNGNVLKNGFYNNGLDIDNNGGTNYNQDTGYVFMDGVIIEKSGNHGCNVQYVKYINAKDCMAIDNSKSVTNKIGFQFQNATRLYLFNCLAMSSDLRQQFGFNITNSIGNAYVYGCFGDANTAIVLNNAINKYGMSIESAIGLGTFTYNTSLASTSSASLQNLNDVVSTLIDRLQKGGVLMKP